jgi:hypothetical protein
MAGAPKQLAAKIELFEMAKGVYILRLNDLAFQPVALKVAGALPEGASSICIVTPTDTKLFSLAGTAPVDREDDDTSNPSARRRIPLNAAGVPDETSDPMDEALRLAEAANREGMGDGKQSTKTAEDLTDADEGSDPRKPNTPRTRKRPDSQRSDVSPNADCSRCGGSGQVNIVGANNEPDTANCPVCQGKGQIHRAGRRR